MTRNERRSRNRLSVGAYGCISVALGLVILLGVWGAYRDIKATRERLLRKEVATIRSHAVRSVGRIERGLEDESSSRDLNSIRADTWIRRLWHRLIPGDRGRLYAAVLDGQGKVIMHSDPQLEGRVLEKQWSDGVVSTVAGDVALTRSRALSGGRSAYDVQVPVRVGRQVIGWYHAGFDAAWFQRQADQARRQIAGRWAVVIAGIAAVVLLAGASLYYLAYRSAALRNVVDMVQLQRVTELGQLAAGLAHEIRNPLHAIRLNLHALGKLHSGRTTLGQQDVSAIIEESNEEIARLDRLIQELLGFAKPAEAREEQIDLVSELRSTMQFVHQEMHSNGVHISTELPDRRALVRMDSTRLRQVILNLLVNAKDATGPGGRIAVNLTRRDEQFEIRVSDNGPGVDEADRQHIFAPFYTTKESGSGLGLALVKRFVEEAGGRIDCETSDSGTTFCVSLPVVQYAS